MSYKHQLKQRVFRNGQYNSVIVHTNNDYGTGKKDTNGVEIFENDKVKFNDGTVDYVSFQNGTFYINDVPAESWDSFEPLVIGHKED